MVKITNVALVAALASFVAATPVPDANAVVIPSILIKERSTDVTLSARESTLGDLLNLIGEVVEFLVGTLGDVLTLDLSGVSSELHTLLDDVSNYIGELGETLEDITLGDGLIGDLQKAILGGSLGVLLDDLESLVSDIVGVIDPDNLTGTLTSDLEGLVDQLNDVLTGITSALGSDTSGLTDTVNSILDKVESLL